MNTSSTQEKTRQRWTRKRVSFGPEYQFLDPFTGRELRFPNRLHRDNFLVQFGEPDIEELIPEHPTISVLVHGQRIGTRFDATVLMRDGTRVLQEVKPLALLQATNVRESTTRQINAQTIYAQKIGASYEIRTEVKIYRYPLLVENKQRMRQILVLHREDSLDDEISYLSYLVSSNSNFQTNELGSMSGADRIGLQRLEAAAYRMYTEGRLAINLKEARYGSAASVASRSP